MMPRKPRAQRTKEDSTGQEGVEDLRRCADAYMLLAEEDAGSLEETRELYQKGVEAGERALGRETFEEDAGYFWGILEIRPYMRARQGLAFCLWELGERQEAIDHYKQMLDLNSDDNLSIRHELAVSWPKN